jgi:hypothetical protein
MSSINDLKNAIRAGNTEQVREIADELVNNGVMIIDALNLAKNLNRTKGKRGKWDDIVDILEEYFE